MINLSYVALAPEPPPMYPLCLHCSSSRYARHLAKRTRSVCAEARVGLKSTGMAQCSVLRCLRPAGAIAVVSEPDGIRMEMAVCVEHDAAMKRGERWLYYPEAPGEPGGDSILMGEDLASRKFVQVENMSRIGDMSFSPELGRVKRLLIEGVVWSSGEPVRMEIVLDEQTVEHFRTIVEWLQ